MKNVVLVVAVLLGLAACGAAESMTPTGENASPVQACEDLQASHRAMAERCGMTGGELEFQYVDCSTVTAIRDFKALYETCLPALAEACPGQPACYPWETPTSMACDQLVF